MLVNPLTSAEADMGGLFYGSTDGSVGGGPIRPEHSLMNDQGSNLAGVAQSDVTLIGSGKTNIYVGGLVALALAGMFLFHYGGLDAHLYIGSRG